MRTSRKGVAEIVGHEGIVLSPYRDGGGTWTVFVGHTAAAGPPNPAKMARGVAAPLAEALAVFRRDLAAVEARIARAVSVPLRQHEFDALVSFDFNTGGIFKARLVRLLNAGDRAGAARAFDGWRKPIGIAERREREKQLFRDGVYAHSGMATLYPADSDGAVAWDRRQRIDVLRLLEREAEEAGIAGPDAPRPDDRPEAAEANHRHRTGALLPFLLIAAGCAALWAVAKRAVRFFKQKAVRP